MKKILTNIDLAVENGLKKAQAKSIIKDFLDKNDPFIEDIIEVIGLPEILGEIGWEACREYFINKFESDAIDFCERPDEY